MPKGQLPPHVATRLYEQRTIQVLPYAVRSDEGITFNYGIQFGFMPVLIVLGLYPVLPTRVETLCITGHTHTWELCRPYAQHYHAV